MWGPLKLRSWHGRTCLKDDILPVNFGCDGASSIATAVFTDSMYGNCEHGLALRLQNGISVKEMIGLSKAKGTAEAVCILSPTSSLSTGLRVLEPSIDAASAFVCPH